MSANIPPLPCGAAQAGRGKISRRILRHGKLTDAALLFQE